MKILPPFRVYYPRREGVFMSDLDPFRELPEGFAMALAQDPAALDAFGRLTAGEKARYVDRAHHAATRQEMRALVDQLRHSGTH